MGGDSVGDCTPPLSSSPTESPPTSPGLPDAAWRGRLRRRLSAWFARHARDLPWRGRRDPYAVWVSEIMLQQTQVATVKPYFERFMAAFPTVGDLARAEPREVLRLWEGLGYYRRAAQLHEAARRIVEDHGGRFPADPEAVRRLPGVGRYTAGAVLSIAFGQRQPILEANTTRLFARLLAYEGDPGAGAGQRLLWALAEAVLPRRGAGTLNQALMELGSMVCLPRGPRCGECPVVSLCAARAQGRQEEVPPPKARRPAEPRREAAVVVRRGGRVLLVQVPPGQRWAGLWDFPRFEIAPDGAARLEEQIAEGVRRLTGVAVRFGRRLKTIKHGVTRFRITLECCEAEYAGRARGPDVRPVMRWLRPAELVQYPLSTTGRILAGMAAAGRDAP